MVQLELEELEDIVVDMQSMLKRAEIEKDISAAEVARKALELDRIFDTSNFTLCIVVEFRYVVDNNTIIRVLKYMLRKVRNSWSFESYVRRAVGYRN